MRGDRTSAARARSGADLPLRARRLGSLGANLHRGRPSRGRRRRRTARSLRGLPARRPVPPLTPPNRRSDARDRSAEAAHPRRREAATPKQTRPCPERPAGGRARRASRCPRPSEASRRAAEGRLCRPRGHEPPRSAEGGARGGTMGFPPRLYDHEPPRRRPAVGRQSGPATRKKGTGPFPNTAPRRVRFLERPEIPVQLPFRELHPVLVPLLPLQLDVAVEDVRAERLAGELGPGQLVDCLAERLR